MPSSQVTIKPLGPIAQAIATVFRAPPNNIRGVDTSDWFGPLQPVHPIAPAGVEPRIRQYPPGANLIFTPRAEEKYGAGDLREASMYDLVRVIIENVLDQVSRMPLNVRLRRRAGESGKDYAKRNPDPAIVEKVSDFLDFPNPNQTRSEFTRQIVDDMLVIDAASILFRTSAKGEIAELRPVDGATIVRYIDEQGITPLPPSPAYAQIWYGIPMVDLTTDQLLYAPRNVKTYRLYGMSPVEQALRWIHIGSKRLEYQEHFYTSGTIPDAMQIIPPGVTPSELAEAQESMNSRMAGILSRRVQLRLVQGFSQEGKDQFIFPKDKALADPFDDLVIRCLCYAFGTSPQRLMRQMNRASAQANQQSADKEGLEPWLDWLSNSVFNRIIQRRMGFKDYEATFEQDSDVDPKDQAVIDQNDVKVGIRSRNEVREDRGLDLRSEPEADELSVVTGTGVIPLSVDKQAENAKTLAPFQPQLNGDQPDDDEPDQKKKPSSKKKPKVGKRRELRIDPDKLSPAAHQAQLKLADAFARVFRRQKDRAKAKTRELLKVSKADTPDESDDPDRLAELIYDGAVASDWSSVPTEAREALSEAILSGVSNGLLQIEVSDSDMISAVNTLARDWARERAAEMVGMKYDDDGNLIQNPNAEWNIAETTRDEIRKIVSAAFEAETNKADIADAIQEALEGERIFSDARAAMIGRTEVAKAQVNGNFEMWKKSGVVLGVKWLVTDDQACDECLDNDGKEVPLGEPFPTGDTSPPVHPNCQCVLVASKFVS